MINLLFFLYYLRLNIDAPWFKLQEHMESKTEKIVNGQKLLMYTRKQNFPIKDNHITSSISKGNYYDEYGTWKLYFGYNKQKQLVSVYSICRK